MGIPITLPEDLEQEIGTVEWQPITVGYSDDAVYRLRGNLTRYLKVGKNLYGEAQRLQWLIKHLPVPKVHYFGEFEGKHYLLLSEIPGLMLHEIDLPPLKTVQLMAQGLRLFHAVPIADCPFDWSLKRQLEASANNVQSGLIDGDLDAPFTGMAPKDAFIKLVKKLPAAEDDLVIVHGDYCLPNILVNPETETINGFIDLGRAGVADRYTDIAVGARSVAYNLGDEWQQPFLEVYGISPDSEKMTFYRDIDNFN